MMNTENLPIIENATVELSSTGRTYRIKANEGYVLHDGRRDFQATDAEGEPLFDENGEPIMVEAFTRLQISCSVSYDFTANPWNLYTKLESEVPPSQILGNNNNPEIM